MTLRQTHGVSRARRLSATENAETQAVLVVDSHHEVVLSLSGCAYPAGLTPEQADFVSTQLAASAERVRDAIAAEQEPSQ